MKITKFKKNRGKKKGAGTNPQFFFRPIWREVFAENDLKNGVAPFNFFKKPIAGFLFFDPAVSAVVGKNRRLPKGTRLFFQCVNFPASPKHFEI